MTRSFDGVGLRPLSPVHIRAVRGMDGAVNLNWIRRTRKGGDSWQGLDVPLAEEMEAYEVEIRDGATVKRVIAAILPAASYSAAGQIADFGSTAFASLDVTIYQLSRSAGRGTGRSARLDL